MFLPREKGRVISVTADGTNVAVYRKTRCDGCEVCQAAANGKYMVAKVDNELGAALGDVVVIDSYDEGADGIGDTLHARHKMYIAEIISKAGIWE